MVNIDKMTVSPLHVPYLGPSQTFVAKTEGVRYVTDQVITENILILFHQKYFSTLLCYRQSGVSMSKMKRQFSQDKKTFLLIVTTG